MYSSGFRYSATSDWSEFSPADFQVPSSVGRLCSAGRGRSRSGIESSREATACNAKMRTMGMNRPQATDPSSLMRLRMAAGPPSPLDVQHCDVHYDAANSRHDNTDIPESLVSRPVNQLAIVLSGDTGCD